MIETAEALLQRREEILEEMAWRNVITDSYLRLDSELRDINRQIDRISRSLEAREATTLPP